jgi:hypothetical protein
MSQFKETVTVSLEKYNRLQEKLRERGRELDLLKESSARYSSWFNKLSSSIKERLDNPSEQAVITILNHASYYRELREQSQHMAQREISLADQKYYYKRLSEKFKTALEKCVSHSNSKNSLFGKSEALRNIGMIATKALEE